MNESDDEPEIRRVYGQWSIPEEQVDVVATLISPTGESRRLARRPDGTLVEEIKPFDLAFEDRLQDTLGPIARASRVMKLRAMKFRATSGGRNIGRTRAGDPVYPPAHATECPKCGNEDLEGLQDITEIGNRYARKLCQECNATYRHHSTGGFP